MVLLRPPQTQTKIINDIVTFLEVEEDLLELYTDLHATGCFTCTSSGLIPHSHIDASDEECIDLCSPINYF